MIGQYIFSKIECSVRREEGQGGPFLISSPIRDETKLGVTNYTRGGRLTLKVVVYR